MTELLQLPYLFEYVLGQVLPSAEKYGASWARVGLTNQGLTSAGVGLEKVLL